MSLSSSAVGRVLAFPYQVRYRFPEFGSAMRKCLRLCEKPALTWSMTTGGDQVRPLSVDWR